MPTPYRSPEEPLARYALHTHAGFYALVTVAALLVAPAVWVFAHFGGFALRSLNAYLALLPALLFSIAAWSAGRQLRVPAGAELRLYRDRVEVPGHRRGDVLSVPIADLRVTLMQHPSSVVLVGFIPIGVDGGFSLIFGYPGGSRALSYRVFASAEVASRAFDDALRVQQGLAPEGPEGRPPPASSREDDAYDRRIDDELRRMD